MKAFECQGYWWLPEAPTNRCAGTLRGNEAGELHLSLLGELVARSFDSDEGGPETVVGIIDEDPERDGPGPKADVVTLRQCLLTSQVIGSSPIGPRQSFFAHRAFFGAHLATADDFRFTSIRLRYSGLGAWADGLTGFLQEPAGSFEARWKHPEPLIEGLLPGGRYILGTGCSLSDRRRERVLRETVTLKLSLHNPTPEPSLERNLVYPLQNFLSFATDHPNSLTSLRVGNEEFSDDEVRIIGPRTFTAESAAELPPFRMLFSLSDVKDRLEDLFAKWLELSAKHSAAMSLYFGTQYDPPRYSDFRFQLMTQALSLYDARRNPSDPGNQERTGDRSLLESHPLVTTERAIRGLASAHRAVFEPFIGREQGEAIECFARDAVAVLRYVLTREPSDTPARTPDGTVYYWFTELLGLLWKISLLDELGFQAEQVESLLSRNQRYRHLRDTVRPRLSQLLTEQ